MFKNLFGVKLLLPLIALFFFSSCEKEDEFFEDDSYLDALLVEIDALEADVYTADMVAIDYEEEWDVEMQRFKGKRPCFRIVFPVNILFPDETSQEVKNIRQMRKAIHTWIQEHPDFDEKPSIEFPFDVKLKDGSTMTIFDEEALIALKKECFRKRPLRPLFNLCFEPKFPLTLEYPDESTVSVVDKEALKNAIKAWKEENPDSAERPHIVFPIQVIMGDELIDVADMDELKELLKDCIEKLKKDKKKGKKGDKGNKGGNK